MKKAFVFLLLIMGGYLFAVQPMGIASGSYSIDYGGIVSVESYCLDYEEDVPMANDYFFNILSGGQDAYVEIGNNTFSLDEALLHEYISIRGDNENWMFTESPFNLAIENNTEDPIKIIFNKPIALAADQEVRDYINYPEVFSIISDSDNSSIQNSIWIEVANSKKEVANSKINKLQNEVFNKDCVSSDDLEQRFSLVKNNFESLVYFVDDKYFEILNSLVQSLDQLDLEDRYDEQWYRSFCWQYGQFLFNEIDVEFKYHDTPYLIINNLEVKRFNNKDIYADVFIIPDDWYDSEYKEPIPLLVKLNRYSLIEMVDNHRNVMQDILNQTDSGQIRNVVLQDSRGANQYYTIYKKELYQFFLTDIQLVFLNYYELYLITNDSVLSKIRPFGVEWEYN